MTARPSAADGAARWPMLGLLFVCRIGLGLQFQTLASVSGSLVAEFGLSWVQVGTLVGLFTLPGLVLSLPAGYVGRRFGDRRLVAFGLLLLAAGGAVAAFAGGMGALAVARLVCGAGFVFATLYFTKMTADWFAGREIATAMSVLVVSWPVGIAIGQLAYVWIDGQFGWRAAFVAASAYCAAGGAAVAWLYRAPAPPREAAAGAGLTRHEWLATLLVSTTWAQLNAAYVVYLAFAPRVLEVAGRSAAEAAAVISVASWAMIVSGPLAGRIADQGRRRDLVLYVSLAVGAAALLLLRSPLPPLASSLLIGLVGMAPAGIVMASMGQAIAPQRRAFGMGVFYSWYFLLVALAPPLAGWLVDRDGDAYAAIVFAALLVAGAALTQLLFTRLQGAAER